MAINCPFVKYLQITSAVLRHATTSINQPGDLSPPLRRERSTATVKLVTAVSPGCMPQLRVGGQTTHEYCCVKHCFFLLTLGKIRPLRWGSDKP